MVVDSRHPYPQAIMRERCCDITFTFANHLFLIANISASLIDNPFQKMELLD